MAALIHLLLGPHLDLAQSRVACGQHAAQHATWDRTLFTEMYKKGQACLACQETVTGPRSPYRGTGQAAISEKQWLQQVLTLAKQRGYLAYHPHRSHKSAPGWPDLVLAKAGRDLYVVELKTAHGALSGHQRHWLETLNQTTGLVVEVWRPEHWPTILEALQ